MNRGEENRQSNNNLTAEPLKCEASGKSKQEKKYVTGKCFTPIRKVQEEDVHDFCIPW